MIDEQIKVIFGLYRRAFSPYCHAVAVDASHTLRAISTPFLEKDEREKRACFAQLKAWCLLNGMIELDVDHPTPPDHD